MSQNDQPHLSLLSLSIAAGNAAPIPPESAPRSSQGATTNTTKHRRLSSAGRSRRRLSDARDAATRPFPTSLQTTSASLAALSLSSPTTSHRAVAGTHPIQVPPATPANGASELVDEDARLSVSPQSNTPLAANSVNVARLGRKRGTIFTCESCSKVYRHPSCLIKHRWEHTPQWREASKFVLSKHQQVQLLEAAAILSHLSPSSASLPEDRSLWPSFLSGGLVPPPVLASNSDIGPIVTTATATSPPAPASTTAPDTHTFPISSSVPASTILDVDRAVSAIPPGGIAEVRPGMLGVPNWSAEMNKSGSPVLTQTAAVAATTEDDALNLLALRDASVGSWGSPTSVSFSYPYSHSRSYSHTHAHGHVQPHAYSHSHSLSYSHSHSHSLSLPSKERERRRSNAYEYTSASYVGSGFASEFGHGYKFGSSGSTYAPDSSGTWSLPSSSVRSKSGSSESGSRSRSQSQSVQSASASECRSEVDDGHEVEGRDIKANPDSDLDLDLEGNVIRTTVREDPRTKTTTRIKGMTTRTATRRSARMMARESRVPAQKGGGEESVSTGFGIHEDGEDEKERVRRGTKQPWDGMEMEMEMD